MVVLYWIYLLYCQIKFLIFKPKPKFRPGKKAIPKPQFSRKKPEWVRREVIYLKALQPIKGCRKIAEDFNRRYEAKHAMTVSKSYVYDLLIKHQYEVRALRKQIKRRKPKTMPKNLIWGIDLTTVSGQNNRQHLVFAVVDYGSRACMTLKHLDNKSSWTLVLCLLDAISRFGKPKAIRSDNEAVFVSKLFKTMLFLCNIKHQHQ